MCKKFLVSIMLICLFTVQANAGTNNGLKAAFDDLNYSLSVEWDQKDKTFYNQQMEKFAGDVKALRAQGLTNQELITFTLSQVKDQKLSKDLETAFNMVAINQMSGQEASSYVSDILNKTYSRGASWNGEVVIGFVFLVVLIAVAAVATGNARVTDECYEVKTCDTYCLGDAKDTCYTDCAYQCI